MWMKDDKVMSDNTFIIKAIPHKGLGMVAARPLRPGELIITEKPLLSLELDEFGDLKGYRDSRSGRFKSLQMEQALSRLNRKDRDKFYSLADAFSGTEKTDFGIIKTNSFSVVKQESIIPADPIVITIGATKTASSLSEQFKKSRGFSEFQEGEEICISYMSPLQRSDFHTKASRQAILRSEFGFNCLCKVCSLKDPDDIAENDFKRKRVLEIETIWPELGATPEEALKLGEEQFHLCLDLCFQSGLMAYVALHCVEAASLNVAKESVFKGSKLQALRKKTLDYSDRAMEFGRIAYGDDSEELEVFRLVQKIANESKDDQLLTDIQSAIAALRDIDS